MIVYVAVNRKNGKAYVGQTRKDVKRRIGNHLTYAGKNPKTPFHKALSKYGRDGFDFAILEQCDTREELDAAEVKWINILGSSSRNGYNRTDGGQGAAGSDFTPERREKIRQSKLGDRNPMKNPETAKKHGDAIRGENSVWWGKFGKEHNCFGRRHKLSEETKEKMREYWNSPEGKSRRSGFAKRGEENVSHRPEVREKISASNTKAWADPERRKRQSEAAQKRWEDPEFRRKHKEGLLRAWANPERRAKLGATREIQEHSL